MAKTGKPPPFRFRFIFHMPMAVTVSLAKGGTLVGGVNAALKSVVEARASSKDGAPKSNWDRLGNTGFDDIDQAELDNCIDAFRELLDRSGDPDEKKLRRQAEAFVDDYLILENARDAHRYYDSVVDFVIKGHGPPGASVTMTQNVTMPESIETDEENEE